MKHKKLIIILLVVITFMLTAYLVYTLSNSRTYQVFGTIISHVETEKKQAALTYDDGPSKDVSPLLDMLKTENIKATFFLIGKSIEENFSQAKAIADSGHEIGNHSYSHERMFFKSYDFMKTEIEKTDELIKKTGYNGNILFRPPFCKKLLILPLYLSNNNRTTVTWDIEPETYLGYNEDPKKVADYTIERVKNGSIILLHPMSDNNTALSSSKIIIQTLKSKGYNFVTVSELISTK